jgi:hypothetical protein
MFSSIVSMASTNTAPSSWDVSDVEAWARRVKLSDETVDTLVGNQVDGPTLVSLQEEELRSKLGNLSLPARCHLWDILESLCSQQQLRSDAAQQRQALEDRILALMAHSNEYFRLPELAIARNLASFLASRGQRPSVRSPDKIASLLDLAIDAFAKNMSTSPSEIKLICCGLEHYRGIVSEEEMRDKVNPFESLPPINALESLPPISRCNTCYTYRFPDCAPKLMPNIMSKPKPHLIPKLMPILRLMPMLKRMLKLMSKPTPKPKPPSS